MQLEALFFHNRCFVFHSWTNKILPLLLEDQSFKESFCCQDITTYSLPVEARIFTGFFFFRERLGMNAGWSGFLLDFRYIGRFPFW